MEDKLFKMLDELDFSETSSLLEDNLTIKMDNKIKKRITKSVKNKAGFYNTNKVSFVEKVKTKLNYIFPIKKLSLSFSVIFLFMGCAYTFAKTPIAFVSLDINPSIEIGINIFERVVSYTPYNDDGNKILFKNAVTNIDAESAVNNLIYSAIHEGYISDNGSTRICIAVATDMTKYLKYENYLKYAATDTLEKNNLYSDINTTTLSLKERKEARSLGMSSGKLNLIKELQLLDSNIKVDDYKNSSITDIYNKYLELKNNKEIEDVPSNQLLTAKDITTDQVALNNNKDDIATSITDSNNNTSSDTSSSNINNNNDITSSSNSNNTIVSNSSNNNSSDTTNSGSSDNNDNSDTTNSGSNNNNNSDTTSSGSSNNNNSDTTSSGSSNNNNSDTTGDDYNDSTSNNKPNNGNHHGHNKPNNGNHNGHYKPNNGNHNGHRK
ncbi:MAG: anti-sigma-I factor RsgI family protein [Peptostreptococcaceae bacterium]